MSLTSTSSPYKSPPVVFVVEDDRSAREKLAMLVCRAGWRPKTFACGEEFLAQPRLLAPGCLVLAVPLPDLDCLRLQRLLSERTELPIIFLAGCIDVPMAVRAMKAGAAEFLIKPFDEKVLLTALFQAFERSSEALRYEAEIRTLRDRYLSLTRREREVMSLVVSGRLNKQVGSELGISEITVKAHRGNLMQKMHATSLPELVTMAATLGLPPATNKPPSCAVPGWPSDRSAPGYRLLHSSRTLPMSGVGALAAGR
jgi:FixJ family two-component response regulator